MSAPLLSVRGLTVRYPTVAGPVTAVRGLDLDVRAGETVAIVGESGSGKSTTAAALVGMLPLSALVSADRLELDGRDMAGATEKVWEAVRGKRIGFVPQDPGVSLDPVQRIGTQVAEALRVHGVPRRVAAERVGGILAAAGLPDPERVAALYPHEMSGGMRQRVLIGIALANGPGIVVADEPTSALDVTVQRQVLDHLQELVAGSDTALVLITHDLGVAADRADRLVVMREGRVVETGPAAQVFAAPQERYTIDLLAASPGPDSPRLVPRTQPPARVSDDVLVVDGLVKSFGNARRGTRVAAVSDVRFAVPRHRTFGLVGESGSGKSTIVRMVLGLERPDAGRIRFQGQEVQTLSRTGLRDYRRHVQLVAQNPYASLEPRFTVGEIVDEPLRAFGEGTRAERGARVAELLDAVALGASAADRRPAELSGGQRQRVAIARALALRPELLVLDEPVSALDVSVQAQILQLLTDLQAELGTSYLFISHDLAVVRQIADVVGVLARGELVESGPTEDLFTRPRAPQTRALLEAIPGRRVRVVESAS